MTLDEQEKEIAARAESTIESILGVSICGLLLGDEETCADLRFRIVPQYWLERFRYDFAVIVKGSDVPVLLIECDGKQFHNSPEARANDAKKDQTAHDHRIRLVRFSGEQIFRFPIDCARGVLELATQEFMRRAA